jgi:hypothetical protein
MEKAENSEGTPLTMTIVLPQMPRHPSPRSAGPPGRPRCTPEGLALDESRAGLGPAAVAPTHVGLSFRHVGSVSERDFDYLSAHLCRSPRVSHRFQLPSAPPLTLTLVR